MMCGLDVTRDNSIFVYGWDHSYGQDVTCRITMSKQPDGSLKWIKQEIWDEAKEEWRDPTTADAMGCGTALPHIGLD